MGVNALAGARARNPDSQTQPYTATHRGGRRGAFRVSAFRQKGQPAYDVAEAAKKATDGDESLGACPVCAGDVVVGKKAYGCSNWRNGCRFVVWKVIAQKEITPNIVQQLLTAQVTGTLTGFISKVGKPFEAKLKLVAGEVKFDFGK